MLKRVTGTGPDGRHERADQVSGTVLNTLNDRIPGDIAKGVSCTVSEASFPAPFPRTLEYNAPVHGTWNIVHIGMAVPQSHSIYVCSDNCMRGVVMTAAEMGCRDRFHCVTILEHDIQIDNLETITIEGVSDVISHLEEKPPVVFVFLVCLHIFVGSDEDYIFRKLSERWPEIHFVKAYMDCVRQKEGPTPDMKLRLAEYEPIASLPTDSKRINILGCDVPYEKDCELITLLTSKGLRVRQLQDCLTYQEYLQLGDAAVNLCTYLNAQAGVSSLSERMNSRYLYLPPAVSYKEIREQILSLTNVCRIDPVSGEWFEQQEKLCEESLLHLKKHLAGSCVAVDYTAHPRPLGIARLLIEHGIEVYCVYLDSILEEEREAYDWLREHSPDLRLVSTILPGMIRYGHGLEEHETAKNPSDLSPSDGAKTPGRTVREAVKQVVGLGQKAAWYAQTDHFVNMIEGGGLWGYQGIRELCRRLEEAADMKQDRMQIIPRKGMGWPSLCAVKVMD